MALGRNLTKRLQRLRSRSNDLNRDANGIDDGFVSISFEQTTDSSSTPATTSPTTSHSHSHTHTPEQGQNEALTTCSSGSSTNSGPREPITPSDLTLEAQRIYNENTVEYFDNALPQKSLHKHTPSNSSSIYSSKQPPPEKPVIDMDARADEMAMDILEKVSADDYLREIRTGSWYIQ